MKSTIIYKKWDIILVSFPFTDLKSEKRRPALIISPDNYNQSSNVVVSFVTSQLGRKYRPGDYHIQEWKKANLPKPSMIRMKFATIDKSIIKRELGRLSEKDIKEFRKELVTFFEK